MRATELTIIERASEASPRQRISAARIRCGRRQGGGIRLGHRTAAREWWICCRDGHEAGDGRRRNVQEAGMGAGDPDKSGWLGSFERGSLQLCNLVTNSPVQIPGTNTKCTPASSNQPSNGTSQGSRGSALTTQATGSTARAGTARQAESARNRS
jgi:hypothetical protein